uniref:Uncharacterized protein n=1 Tax=Panagrellus redivivus TaxID=6233 RepID=A0A7E4VKC5_PANRE
MYIVLRANRRTSTFQLVVVDVDRDGLKSRRKTSLKSIDPLRAPAPDQIVEHGNPDRNGYAFMVVISVDLLIPCRVCLRIVVITLDGGKPASEHDADAVQSRLIASVNNHLLGGL